MPVVLLLAWFVAPLVGGGKTLFLRDVLQTHLADRIGLATSLRQPELPLIPLVDPLRAGGQALAGNLNALPFYPDNVLLLLAWPGAIGAAGRAALWALNAHFWLHWFLALGGALWMGRAFGLSRPAAWMAATVYAFSGYFASQLNLYNTVAAAALAPALVAAVLETAPGKAPAVRRRGLVCAALLWALLVLGGEPLLALLALALAMSAGILLAGRRALSGRLALALLSGTLLAAPQIVEALRILPISFRLNAAFGEPQAIVGSFRWAHLADFAWPFFFGRPNLSEVFAPHQFDGHTPLLFTLYPGLLALAFAATGLARRGRATSWGAGAIVVALFFALGRFNPVVEALWSLPWRLLRFPAKFWLLAAVGGSLLAGIGFEAISGRGPEGGRTRRILERWLLLFAGAYVAFLAAANLAPRAVKVFVGGLLSPTLPAATLDMQLVRMQGLAVLSLGLLALAWGLVRLGRSASGWTGGAVGALVALHAATQLWAILPAVPMDDAQAYLAPPPILAAIPAGSVVVHGANLDLFPPSTMNQGNYPDPRLLWRMRRSARELYPFAAMLHGLRSELAISAEGLDSFLSQALTVGVKNFSDRRRLDVLEALGVDYLLLDRELAPEARAQVLEIAREENFGQTVRLYELADRAREVEFATRVIPAPQMNAALEAIFDPAFDPHRTVVVPGTGEVRETFPPIGGEPQVRLVANRREEVVIEVSSSVDGILYLRRAFLPLWRVAIDGASASTVVAQVAHLGVAVPAGRHQVRFWIDRRPLAAGLGLALLGLLGLGWLLAQSPHAPRPARPPQRPQPLESAPVADAAASRAGGILRDTEASAGKESFDRS